jgi:hypothetical protein
MNRATPKSLRAVVESSRKAAIARALEAGIPMRSILVATATTELREELARIPALEAALERAAQSVAEMVKQRDELIAMANRNRILYQARLKKLKEERDAQYNMNIGLARENAKLRQEIARLSLSLDD